MITRYSIKSLFQVLFLLCIPATSAFPQASDDVFNILFSNDFEDNTIGVYDYNEWVEDWRMGWDAWINNREITYIEQKEDSKAMKWIFPEGTVDGIDQGGKFHPNIPGLGAGYTELYFSYNIMFKPDFDFVISGKIPSMGGGEDWNDHGGAPYYDEGFSCGLAWFKTYEGAGGLRFYIYHHDQPTQYGDTRNWSDPASDVYRFPTDGENWVNITIRIVLNTVNTPPENGNNDGFVEGFINGKLMERWEGLRFRNLESIGIDYMKIYSQFGGVEDIFRTKRDEWILTDDYYLFTYADDVDVPRGHTYSAPGRVLQLPNMEKINAQNGDQPDTDAPAVPQGLKASKVTSNSINVQWSASSDNVGVAGYNVYLNNSKTGSSENTSFSITGLTPETNYNISVSAFDEAGNVSARSNVLKVLTPTNVPADPSGLSTRDFTSSSVTLLWVDNSNNESGFQIQRADKNLIFKHRAILGANSTLFTDNEVESGEIYYYRVRAFNAYENSAFSNTLQVILPKENTFPNDPTDLIATHIDHTKVVLNWTDNSGNEDIFEIQRADESLNFEIIAETETNAATFTDLSVQPGSVYYYRVRAQNYLGYSDFTNSIETVIPAQGEPPLGPSDFTGSNDRYLKVNLNWTDNSFSESGFLLQRGDANMQFHDIDTIIPNALSYTDSIDIYALVTYYYRIRAYNEFGFSEYSDTLSFTIFDMDLPDPPTLLDASEISHKEVKILWQDNSTNESGFIIKRAPYPSENFDPIVSISENSSFYVDDKILPGETYYYVVNAVNEKGESENSNKIRITSLSLNDSLRIDSGLIVQYNFSMLSDSIVVDRSRYGTPLDLVLRNPDEANLKNSGKLEIKSNTSVHSRDIASKIIDACMQTNEISVECWLKSRVSMDFIPQRIIALQNDDGQGFALNCFSDETDPQKIKYGTNLTTATTDDYGNPLFSMEIATDAEVLQHIVFTHNNSGDERIYLNGQEVINGYRPADYNNWKDNYSLVFGNNDDDNLPWLGDLYLCSFYDRALSEEEVQINYLASPFTNLDYMLNSHAYEIVAFPNPSDGIVNISISNSTHQTDITEKYFIRIVDVMGHTIYNQDVTDKIDDESFELNVSSLSSGFYTIVLFNRNELINATKLLINH